MNTTAQLQFEVALLFKKGLALHQQGQLAKAHMIYQQLLAKDPNHFDALHLSGLIAAQNGNPILAADLIEKALQINSSNAAAHFNRALALQELNRLEEAISSYDKAITLKPNDAEAHFNRGNALQKLKRPQEALGSYDRAIALKPKFTAAYYNRGIGLDELNRTEEAIECYEKALLIKPDFAEANFNHGNALQKLKRLQEAITSYDRAILIRPDYAEAYSNRGNVFLELDLVKEAIASFAKAISIKPDYAEAHSNLGAGLQKIKRLEEAITCYDRAISIKPGYAEAYSNRGSALVEIKRFEEAEENYHIAISIDAEYADAYSNLGNLMQDLRRTEKALASYDKAITINPKHAKAYYNRGTTLLELKRFDEALLSYEAAIDLEPDYAYLHGLHLHTKMGICEWQDFEKNVKILLLKIDHHKKSSPCLPVLALTDSLASQLKNSKIWANDKHPHSSSLGPILKPSRHEKIKIGYYSADFRNHAISHLMAEMLEMHDKNAFEIFAFNLYPSLPDETSARIFSAVTQVINLGDKSDRSAAQLSRALEIDIAIDLGGHTTYSRTGIFAHRCAPVQVNYLGFPGTLGATYYDYILADAMVIPEDQKHQYMEKVVYLPNCYQPNDSQRRISDRILSRTEVGLPDYGFVFCCFNNSYKILPETFEGWMRILHAAEGSVLWLLDHNQLATRNLKREAQNRGIDASRLVFADRVPLADHLARHRLADLFIDTFPYNAHTTASDALWAGLPVLTRVGQSFAARVAASLLNAIELPELITTTQEQYEAAAIELATNPIKFKAINNKLQRNRMATALFDTPRFTKHIESAYTEMYECYRDELPLEHIYIKNN